MSNEIHSPYHYTRGRYEVKELARYLSFDAGNFVKYVMRAPYKGNEYQDICKALYYAEDLAKLAPGQSVNSRCYCIEISTVCEAFVDELKERGKEKKYYNILADLMKAVVHYDTWYPGALAVPGITLKLDVDAFEQQLQTYLQV